MFAFSDYYDPYSEGIVPGRPLTVEERRRQQEEAWLAAQRRHLAEKAAMEASQRPGLAPPAASNPFAPGGWASGVNAVDPRTATPAMVQWWAGIQQRQARQRPILEQVSAPPPSDAPVVAEEPKKREPAGPQSYGVQSMYQNPMALAAAAAGRQNNTLTQIGDDVEDAIQRENESRVRQMREARAMQAQQQQLQMALEAKRKSDDADLIRELIAKRRPGYINTADDALLRSLLARR